MTIFRSQIANLFSYLAHLTKRSYRRILCRLTRHACWVISVKAYTLGDSDVISSYHIYASPPWCGASSEKCLLLWNHFLSKIVIMRTSS